MGEQPDSSTEHGNQRSYQDGRVDLADDSVISSSPLYNHDLAPIPVARRSWSMHHFIALWAGMACNIPTYMLSSGLIAAGMNWWQALMTILLGNSIVLIPILLNSHPGTKYGIPFPVLARASYGVWGSNVPALMRALIACGWFGINAWIGGQAMHTLLKTIYPSWTSLTGIALGDHTLTEWVSFSLFWLLNILVIYHGMEMVKKLETWAAPFVFTMTAAMAAWTVFSAHGFGSLLSQPGKFHTLHDFMPVFVPSVTAMIGSWATLSLNMPDFTRFSRSQHEQVIGQTAALPASMTLFAAMGVVITSTGMVLFPHLKLNQLWDPVTLIGQFNEPLVVAMAMFTVMLATLSVNIAANVVSPANDLANCFPRYISFRTGALITGIVGLLMQPWKLMADPRAYIFDWLLGYSGGLGSIAGVMIADYWLIKKKTLQLVDLYLPEGEYTYSNGWNWCAVVATAAGCFFAWIGLIVHEVRVLYDYAWFIGFFVAFAGYFILMKMCSRAKP